MGHPVLRTPARAIDVGEVKSARIQQLIDDMFETMTEYGGVGLAAPQVHEGIRLFVAGFAPAAGAGRRGRERSREETAGGSAPRPDRAIRTDSAPEQQKEEEEEQVPLMALVNPDITVVGSDLVEDWEGCLSIPDIRGRVPRARSIVVHALDRRGKRVEVRAAGFTARVIQHETDHLNGILFFDRMATLQSLTFVEELARYGTGQDVVPE